MEISSPNGRVKVAVGVDPAGRPYYRVGFGATDVVDASSLWLVMREGGLLADHLRVVDSHIEEYDETYLELVGKTHEVRNRYREGRLSLEESVGRRRHLVLFVRAYDDGFAIRYEIPNQEAFRSFELLEERFEFRFHANHRCWTSILPNFLSSFEAEYPESRLGDLRVGALHSLPMVVDLGGAYAALGEANVRNHAGIYFESRAGVPNALVTSPSPLHRADSLGITAADTPHLSPWRFVMLADSPAGLVESNLMHNLNDPCAVKDASWIKPGKVAWDWWSGPVAPGKPFKAGMNDPTFHYFIDFAATLGLEYCMIDGGWYQDDDVMKSQEALHVPELVRYANSKGVDVLVWMHSAHLKPKLKEAFEWYESIGVKGVKIDFFDRNDQDTQVYIERILQEAMKRHLMVNLHGVFSPTGLERTYPHLMTMEGVLGAEYNKWSRRVTPGHNLTLPFTRNLMGPMDYTVGVFTNVTSANFVPRNENPMAVGTRAHHLAMYVVYQSGWQMVSDYPDAILDQPGAEFIRAVPTVWDETRVLLAEVARLAVVARRKGNRWFVGGMTVEPRSIELPLSFLSGPGELEIFRDAKDSTDNPTHLEIEKRSVDPSTLLRVELAEAGGFAAIVG